MNEDVQSRKPRYERPTLSEVALRPDGFHSRCSPAALTPEPELGDLYRRHESTEVESGKRAADDERGAAALT